MSLALNASASGGSGSGDIPSSVVLWLTRTSATSIATTPTKHAIAVRGCRPSFSPDAATISGDGVSPAASAAAIGSPPGSAIATFNADEGRLRGSVSRQRRITRSIVGSRSLTSEVGVVCESPGRRPVNISCNTRPSEYRSLRVVTSLPAFCSGDM